jgi:two-component system sensor histidine kinase DesK
VSDTDSPGRTEPDSPQGLSLPVGAPRLAQATAVPTSFGDIPAPRLARGILVAVLLSYLLITGLNVLREDLPPLDKAGSALGLGAVFVLQLVHSAPSARQASVRRRATTLTLQVLVTYLPLLVYASEWGGMAGFLAGSLLLLLPGAYGWAAYGLVGLSMLVQPVLAGRSLLDSVYLCESTLLTGLVVYALTSLAELVDKMHRARQELARMAVVEERMRFARDLHDLLGYSLSAITLKGELIHRLVPAHPERARAEISSVLEISRQALADVRTVASGYRRLSLADEAASARSVLGAADVSVDVRVSVAELDPQVETVLATVLREGVTNVLRHSKVRHCEIAARMTDGAVRLSVLNDGVDEPPAGPSPDSGSGLGNLGTRLGLVGGTLEADRLDDGRFRLEAMVPTYPVGFPAQREGD